MPAQLGATDSFTAGNPDCIQKVRDATSGGVGYAFETAGSVAVLELAYQITRRGDTTVTVGLAHPERKVALQQVSLVAEERTIKGSYVGGCMPLRDVPPFIALPRQGRLPVDRLVSERPKLEEINAGFDRLADGKTIRQLLIV